MCDSPTRGKGRWWSMTSPTARPPFYTPAQMASLVDPEPNWIVEGYVAQEAITEIDGKVKAAGKTTFILLMLRAIFERQAFLGQRTDFTTAVYYTEQQKQPFYNAVTRAGLAKSEDLHVLFKGDASTLSWPAALELAVAKAAEVGARLLIIDTIAKLAHVTDENETKGWDNALSPLQQAAGDHHLAILFARHSRKGYAEVGESGRGNSAASGDVDVILDLRRPEGATEPTRRILQSLSRYEATPDKILIQMSEDEDGVQSYELLGTESAVSMRDAMDFVMTSLGSATEPMSREALIAASDDGNGHKQSESSIRRGLTALMTENRIDRHGSGKKGDPFTYSLASLTPHVGQTKVNRERVELPRTCSRCKKPGLVDEMRLEDGLYCHRESCEAAA